MGDLHVILSCNITQSSVVRWTMNTILGYFNVSVNGTITDYQDFREKYFAVNSSSLRIYIIELTDSGFYDCYEIGGRRILGYNLTVTRMLLIVSPNKIATELSSIRVRSLLSN